MEKKCVQLLARSLMNKYGLNTWLFQFDNAKTRFGLCNADKRTISLSLTLCMLNNYYQVKETILHEIAHALVGPGIGHSRKWKQTAKSIGCNGHRCYDLKSTITPYRPIQLRCSNCNIVITRYRKPKRKVACTDCCNKYNNGHYSTKFIVTVSKIQFEKEVHLARYSKVNL